MERKTILAFPIIAGGSIVLSSSCYIIIQSDQTPALSPIYQNDGTSFGNWTYNFDNTSSGDPKLMGYWIDTTTSFRQSGYNNSTLTTAISAENAFFDSTHLSIHMALAVNFFGTMYLGNLLRKELNHSIIQSRRGLHLAKLYSWIIMENPLQYRMLKWITINSGHTNPLIILLQENSGGSSLVTKCTEKDKR